MPYCSYKVVSCSDQDVTTKANLLVETLSLLVERHNQNALALAKWLEKQPSVSGVDPWAHTFLSHMQLTTQMGKLPWSARLSLPSLRPETIPQRSL
jgi:cystathionine beta-lyase/cystathionine gamma-synthase